jgi:hypothetical protein
VERIFGRARRVVVTDSTVFFVCFSGQKRLPPR